ncbi:hypothetical protein PROFUN_01380 [Planoprotostelium fungivorum]|uniref:Uncharacterized protein n=1 Tax=Planoprotostelium fungivorum TaxID=1890364 RepID=A0A2P6NTB4_9EUKA|nr:hypothetical protein PROFUN_01380 [Planoprotostelium fungivorum]
MKEYSVEKSHKIRARIFCSQYDLHLQTNHHQTNTTRLHETIHHVYYTQHPCSTFCYHFMRGHILYSGIRYALLCVNERSRTLQRGRENNFSSMGTSLLHPIQSHWWLTQIPTLSLYDSAKITEASCRGFLLPTSQPLTTFTGEKSSFDVTKTVKTAMEEKMEVLSFALMPTSNGQWRTTETPKLILE